MKGKWCQFEPKKSQVTFHNEMQANEIIGNLRINKRDKPNNFQPIRCLAVLIKTK